MASQASKKAEAIALNEAIQAVQSSAELIGSLMGDIKDNAVILATLRAEVQVLKDEVCGISNILTDGSTGVKPLQTRVGLLENQTERFSDVLHDLKEDLEHDVDRASSKEAEAREKQAIVCVGKFSQIEEKVTEIEKKLSVMELDRDIKLEKIKGRWQLYVALATGVIAFFGVLLTFLDKYLG